MELRIQIVAVTITLVLFLTVFELVRRRRLMERYALLWMVASITLLLLALWKGLLLRVASTVGIFYAPSALFVIAFGFVLVLLLHFSLVISKLSDQNKLLAQRIGMMQERLTQLERSPEPVVELEDESVLAGERRFRH
jgi:hypothetical protein